jgi:hypothetical protein
MKLQVVEGIVLDFEGATDLASVQSVGIENLKKVAEFASRFRNKVIRYKADGKIDWFERFGISISIMGSLKLISVWQVIKKEIEDLDEAEYLQLLEVVSKGFEFDADLAKDYFGEFISFIDGLRQFLSKQN